MEVPECNVCSIPLDEDEHQPRHLGCSHDACTTCVNLLIKDGFLECPMCRKVIRANNAEDLPINHGVVQVLRLFRGFKLTESKTKEVLIANEKLVCEIHHQPVIKGCLSCKVWICAQCTEFHTSDIGCEVLEFKDYIIKTKKDHKKKIAPTLLCLRKNLKSLSTDFSDLEVKKKEIEENMEKLKITIEEGTNVLNKFVDAAAYVDNAKTSIELDKRMNTSTKWHQFSQNWCKKNSDTSVELLEKIKIHQEMYASMDIGGKSTYGKLTLEDGNIYLHCFRNYEPKDIKSLNVFPYDQVQAWMPTVHDLMFLDLAIFGVVKGRITIRLRQDLPSYAKCIPLMFTGEEGQSLLGLECLDHNTHNLGINISSINNNLIKLTRDDKAGHKAVQGSVLFRWSGNRGSSIYIYHENDTLNYEQFYDVFGEVETGLNIVKLCRKHSYQNKVTVVDCGLVIKSR